MRSVRRAILCAFFAGCTAAASVAAQAGVIFNFQFDNQGLVSNDGPLVPPIVGSGTFTSPTNLTPGTYDLSALSGFSLSFSFADGVSFTTADITTPLTGVAVRIEEAGGAERLFFTEGSGAGADGGSQGGSLDLTNGSNFLSFEPTFVGGNFLYAKNPGNTEGAFSGIYVALDTPVPEPATLALVGFGLLGLAASRRRAGLRAESRP